jgi:RNA polymerase sigma-70 factor (ECF subfamily)
MGLDDFNQNLSEISTKWVTFRKAHQGPAEEVTAAQLRMMQRYYGAVHRYLLGALRDPHAADELTQEFAFRFMRGDFQGADPRRGRFRDYLKTVLRRLVANHFKQRQAEPVALPPVVADPLALGPDAEDTDDQFLSTWRRELLNRAWQSLKADETKKHQPYYTLLRLRLEHPVDELSSAQLAKRLETQFGKPFSSDNVRKLLQRARERLARYLLDEVAQSLQEPTTSELEQELRDLGLLGYCRSALAERVEDS